MSNYVLRYKLDDNQWSTTQACFLWVPSYIPALTQAKKLSVWFTQWQLTDNDRFFIDELTKVFGSPVETEISEDGYLTISLDLTKFPRSFRNYYSVLGAARLVCENLPPGFSDNFRYFRETGRLSFFQSMLAAHEFVSKQVTIPYLPSGHEYFNTTALKVGHYPILEFKDDAKIVERFYTEDLGGPYTPLSSTVWPSMGKRKNPFKQRFIGEYTSILQMT